MDDRYANDILEKVDTVQIWYIKIYEMVRLLSNNAINYHLTKNLKSQM